MIKEYPLSELLQLIKSGISKQSQFVFDCDGTLVDGDVSSLTGWQLMKAGMVDMELLPEPYQKPAFYLKMSLEDYYRIRSEIETSLGHYSALEWELKIQSGIPHQIVVDYAHVAIDFGLANNFVSYTAVMSALLKDHAPQSWVVSGSSFPTVLALAEKFKVDEERVLATRLELVDGVYQKNFTPPGFIWEENKVVALKESGVTAPYFVAGDSYGDWNMMQLATDWVWCLVWNKRHFGNKNYREFLSSKLPFAKEIPHRSGFYHIVHEGKNWVFEVIESD
ncbi:MAG: haloacid dehalogenase-like hydrolase [Bdellovibrionota bacterium]